MSKFMQSLLKKKAEAGTKVQEKLQGEGYLYSGDPAINWGTGGWVRGKLNLIYGPHKSGKTTLALIAAGAEQQKTNGWIVIFDSEYAHPDPNEEDSETGKLSARAVEARERYEAHGIDIDKLLIISSNQVDHLFEPLPEFEKQCRDGSLNISAIVCDSWAGIQGESSQKKIEEGEIASAGNSFGGNAKTLGPVLQTLLRVAAENAITTFIIQHCIQNMEQYGPRFKLLGGEKLKYLVHMVLFVESVEAKDAGLFTGELITGDKKDGVAVDAKEEVRIGKKIRYRCEKSRRVVEGRQGEFFMNFKDVKFAKPEVSLQNLATNLGIMGLELTPEFEKDGVTPVIDKKTGRQKVKQSTTNWVFPVGSPSPYKFVGKPKLLEELRTNKVFFQQVYDACMATDRSNALAAGESLTEVGDA
jgi:RecA/RadA recombinase